MTDARADVDRAFRWQSAKEEFFDPFFAKLREEYQKRHLEMCVNEPWATNKLILLAAAIKAVDGVEAQGNTIIAAGIKGKAEKTHADKIAAIPLERRRLMGLPLN